MREHFPQQEIGIGELGYWIPDQRLWWSYDKDDPLGKAMAEVAEQDYCAALDYDRSVGGCFWWNFIKEFQDNPALPKAVADLRDSLTER
jgi:hypothetical protein